MELLTPYLGKPEKQSGDEYFWQCPLCKDTSRNNLKFNTVKKVLWCFADESHAPQIFGEIFKNNKNFTLIKPDDLDYNSYDKFKRFYTVQKQINFSAYMQNCNETLLRSDIRLRQLLYKRGITRTTARFVKIGVDENKKRWVIPAFKYSTEHSNIILGFEYRPFDFNKNGLTREKGAPTGLAMINSYKPTTEILAVVEGYFDGYALYQHLWEQKQTQEQEL